MGIRLHSLKIELEPMPTFKLFGFRPKTFLDGLPFEADFHITNVGDKEFPGGEGFIESEYFFIITDIPPIEANETVVLRVQYNTVIKNQIRIAFAIRALDFDEVRFLPSNKIVWLKDSKAYKIKKFKIRHIGYILGIASLSSILLYFILVIMKGI
jgi:hypothetical protein